MVASYQISQKLRLKLVSIRGKTQYSELENLFFQYIADPEHRPGLNLLVDLSGLEDVLSGLWEIRKLHSLYSSYCSVYDVSVKIAIFSDSNLTYRAARSFSLLGVGNKSLEVRVFRDFTRALVFLELPVGLSMKNLRYHERLEIVR